MQQKDEETGSTFSSVESLSSTKWHSAPGCLACSWRSTSLLGWPVSAVEIMRSGGSGRCAALCSRASVKRA